MIIEFIGGPRNGEMIHSDYLITGYTYGQIESIGVTKEYAYEIGKELDSGAYEFNFKI